MALSKDTPLTLEEGIFNELPMAASVTIYEGSLTGLNGAGYARALVAGDIFVGHALRGKVDATATNGGTAVRVRRGRYLGKATLSGAAVTSVGKEIFASADNTFTLTKGANSRVGVVHRYVTTSTVIIEFQPAEIAQAYQGQVMDCESGADATTHLLIPAQANPSGLLIVAIWGRVTEVFAGATQDQGVVTVSDESNNALATITVADASADAAGDVRLGYVLPAATAGDAMKTVAAGEFVDMVVTQNTSGTGAAGKLAVYIAYLPLA
jgi:hypothetical protein